MTLNGPSTGSTGRSNPVGRDARVFRFCFRWARCRKILGLHRRGAWLMQIHCAPPPITRQQRRVARWDFSGTLTAGRIKVSSHFRPRSSPGALFLRESFARPEIQTNWTQNVELQNCTLSWLPSKMWKLHTSQYAHAARRFHLNIYGIKRQPIL
jgi:hypothetical protein